MADQFHLTATCRSDHGTRATRRLRKENQVPGVVYGGGKSCQSIQLSHKEMIHALSNEAIYSHILTLRVDGKNSKVIIKSLDRHPHKPQLLHIDFMRISAKEKLHMHIPIHFIGEADAPGIKEEGGVLTKHMTEIEIKCLPADLPEKIEIDISSLPLNGILHISDLLPLPTGVELAAPSLDDEHNQAVVSIHLPAVAEEEAEAEEAPAPQEAETSGKKEETSEQSSGE